MARRPRRVLRLLLFLLLALIGAVTLPRLRRSAFPGPRIGIVDVDGVIGDTTDLLETLKGFQERSDVVGVVLRIDSPGGSVASAQDAYTAVRTLRETKPVVASFGNTAASAAYYIGSAADVVVSSPGTLTGSIGAIMEFPYVGPLAEKVGVDATVVKSGAFKDIGSPLRRLSEEERTLLQGMVDDVLRQFVEAVAEARALPIEQVRAVADGRVFSGAQAKAVGLVDQLGGLDLAVRVAWERAGRSGEPRSERSRHRRWPWWVQMLEGDTPGSSTGLGRGLLLLYQGAFPR